MRFDSSLGLYLRCAVVQQDQEFYLRTNTFLFEPSLKCELHASLDL